MSRPARGKLLLVLAFVLTLGSGIVVGIGLSKQSPANTLPTVETTRPSPDSWLKNKLNLSAEQSEQMKAIWSQAMEGKAKELSDKRRALFRERESAIEALYTPEQRAERKKLQEQFDVKISENRRENEKVVQGAVEKTKALLTEPQRKVYEEILRERSQRDRHRGGPSTRSSTQPSDRPPPFGGPPGFDRRRGGEDGDPRGGPERGGERGGDRGPEPRHPDSRGGPDDRR